MKNLQKLLKQSSIIVYTTTPHIRTVSSGRGAVAAKNFRLLLPQQDNNQQQHHGGGIIVCAACHTKLGAVVGETFKRLLHHHVTAPCINMSKRGFCSMVGDHTTREITVKNSYVGAIVGRGGGEVVRGIEIDSITIADSMAGFLLGRGAERIKRMKQQSGARIRIGRDNEYNDGERMVAITGGNEQVELALKLINEAILLYEGTADDGILEHSGDTVKKMSISHHMVGMIMGVGAATVRQLEAKSGADILLSRGEPASSTADKVVIIKGTPEQVQLAQELIEDVIKQEHGLSASDGDVERTELRVTNDEAGFLIGQGGETLEEIRQKSGARIYIHNELETRDLAVTGKRVIIISGGSDQIERAQDLIWTCLQEKKRQKKNK